MFSNKKAESDLNSEIAHHLHHLAAEYERQGHSPKEARQLALREFGARDQVKEECRDERPFAWLTGFRQDLVFGLRMLRRAHIVTAAAVLSLALGIGANAAIASLMDIVLWRDLPVPDPARIVLVNWQGQGFPRELANGASGSMFRQDGFEVADFFAFPAYESMRRTVASQATLAAYTFPAQVSVAWQGRPLIAEQRPVAGNFLATLQVRPHLGRIFSLADDTDAAPAVAVLSHRFWANTLAADPAVIGRTLTIDNRPHIIAGVLEPAFYGLFPGDTTEIYTPIHHAPWRERERAEGNDRLLDPRNWSVQLIARLAPGVTAQQLSPALNAAFRSTWSAQPTEPAPAIRLEDGRRGLGVLSRSFRNPLYFLGALVALLLIIACANIANLLLARGHARRKEIALRMSIGCSRFRLIRQFLTESALLAIAGGAAAILVAYAAANLLGQFVAGNGTLPLRVSLDHTILAAVALFTFAALIVFALFPAWQSSRLSDPSWLKQGRGSIGGIERRAGLTGRILVTAQVAMSLVLVMAAILFTRNLLSVRSADPGFDRRNLVVFGVRPGASGYEKSRLMQFYFDLEQRLAATPGVASAGLAWMRPMNVGGWWQSARLKGQTATHQTSVNAITPAYLPLYAPQLLAGRNFTWSDLRADAKVAIISEDLARALGGPQVLGQVFEFPDGPPGAVPESYQIIGIAPAIAATSMKERPYAIWVPFSKAGQEATVVVRTTQSPDVVLPALRQTMAAIDPNLPMVDTVTMEEQISKTLLRERMFATLCLAFGLTALALCVVGLYGVLAYYTSRRRAEIGVRLALGARPSDVVAMVLRDGLTPALIGIALGLPAVYFGARYVQEELSAVKPLDPASLTLTLATLLGAALFAAGIPALRASLLHPLDTLREE
ncbi:MAG: ABC transporter permease [Bryobacteraceae bacterium]|nr:ABC transporter permease [Bryobacteraceae bacterium]